MICTCKKERITSSAKSKCVESKDIQVVQFSETARYKEKPRAPPWKKPVRRPVQIIQLRSPVPTGFFFHTVKIKMAAIGSFSSWFYLPSCDLIKATRSCY